MLTPPDTAAARALVAKYRTTWVCCELRRAVLVLADEVDRLRAEVDSLRRLVLGLAERCAGQSEALRLRAERDDRLLTEQPR